jgi:type II secretory pathway component PulL
MRFDLDEPLIPDGHCLPGLVSAATIARLEEEWKVAKVDEWCAVAALNAAADQLRATINSPSEAPIGYVVAISTRLAGHDTRTRRALAGYETAASQYEGVLVHLTDLRNQATIPAA